jgi:hypothetical protein
MRPKHLAVGLVGLAAVFCAFAAPDIAAVVNEGNRANSITLAELRGVFVGESRSRGGRLAHQPVALRQCFRKAHD